MGRDTEFNVLFEPNDKTTINIVDDDGMYFTKRSSWGLKMRSSPVAQN